MGSSILVVDDHASLLSVLSEALELSGYQVQIARGGQEATSLLESGVIPDIIVCDIMMPDMDGMTFLRRVRGSIMHRGVHFIAMSGNGADRASVLAAGANDYIAKPFSIPDLLRLLEAR